MDIKTGFLNSGHGEREYMAIPEGLSVPANPDQQQNRRQMVCHWLKSIYGVKKSACAWSGRIYGVISLYNLIRSESDHSLFSN